MDLLSSFLALFPVSLAQGLIYSFVAVGIMIPFRILNFPDLTSEGAFPLGACLCAALIVAGVHPLIATLAAVCGGFVVGCTTAIIHLKLRINSLLAGILVLTMLWSIDLRIMGRSNVSIFGDPNLFDAIWPGFTSDITAQMIAWAGLVLVTIAVLYWFLQTELGLALRCVGSSDAVARAQGINVSRVTLLGVGAASSLTAFSGAAVAQVQGYADVAMGFGMLINGLAALIIGEALTGKHTVLRQVLAPFVGSVTYYQILSFGLAAGVHPSDLKLVTAVFVIVTLAIPALRKKPSGTVPERRINA